MIRRLIAALLAACALLGGCAAAAAEGAGTTGTAALRGYTRADGYLYVTLGRYPQTREGEVQPILWRILTVDGEKAYLCSEYVLFARPMHPDLKEYRDVLKGDFAQTELCHYLNTTFAAAAFTEAELAMLLPCGDYGKVFLLDASDVTNKAIGMGKQTNMKREGPGLRAWGTEWAIHNNNAEKEKERLYVFQKKFGSHSPYWVRNQSTTDGRHARCTKDGGQLGHIEVGRENEGVRPALYLALDRYAIAGGAGTMEDPYVLIPAGEAEPEPESDVIEEIPFDTDAEETESEETESEEPAGTFTIRNGD